MADLVEVGRWLRRVGYQFVVPTPETYRRVNARDYVPDDHRGAFGWSRPFGRHLLPSGIIDALGEHLAPTDDGRYRVDVRFATLGPDIFACSSHPTETHDAVFFGPDTYRFCAAVHRRASCEGVVADIGCGSGAGGLSLACAHVILADANPRALAFARVNAVLAGRSADVVDGDLFENVPECDLAIANPPYIAEDGKLYSDGGVLGTEIALRIVEQAKGRAKRLIMYTGAPIIDGRDQLRTRLPLSNFTYEELDPDVFGEELDRPQYARVERIAAVVLDVRL